MTDINYYDPLTITNEAEQSTLGQMQAAFNSAITSSNSSQDTMISSYMSANASRKACYNECPQGWSADTTTWESKIKKDSADTAAASVALIPEATSCAGYDCSIEGQFCPKGSTGASAGNYICTNKRWIKTDSRPSSSPGLKDVIASCRAGCDLKWPGIVQNAAGTQGVDGGQAIGRYTGTSGKEHDITQCTDLSKFAPKVKLGGICDANEECESSVCVNWGSKCARPGETFTGCESCGRCGLGMARIDGSNYAWGNTWNSMCKKNVEQYGLVRWSNHTQYFKYQGIWVKLSPDWGFPSAPDIENQRLENGQYIQDVATALQAAEAYGDYCKGFYQQEGKSGFILQSAGGANPKPSWSAFLSQMSELNANQQEGFTADTQDNKILIEDPKKLQAWGNFYGTVGGKTVTAKQFDNPTFPIAKMDAAMKKTCPKGWKSIRNGRSCEIDNSDMRATTKGGGWNGSSFGCNLPNTDNYMPINCIDVPNDNFTCWVPSRTAVPKGKAACKPIKGRDIESCLSSGGRAREAYCPVAAKMILYIGRPSSTYFATTNDIVSVMQQISTEFPDVRLTDQKEMDDIIAKNIAFCAYGWYRTDVYSGTTWRTANASWNGPGIENLPIANRFPSNAASGSGCGSGKVGMVGGGTKATGGIYITVTATQEIVEQKLTGLGFNSWIIESHQQLIKKPPPPPPPTSCPASHPYAYRPNRNFDYCCESSKDSNGTSGANSRYPRSSRSSSCQYSQYTPCAHPPCADYKPRDADSCRGWKCSTEGQFCPPDRSGSGGAGFCCRSGKWISGACNPQESFVGGMKEGFTGKEGYAPLENDMIYQCKAAGTQGGDPVPGVAPTGNFLIENRKKEKTTFSKLQSMQKQVKNSINQMQSDNLNVNSLYKTKNTDLLKQLASYEQASHKLLKTGSNLDTLGAQQSDSLLRKNSVDMSYYLWLTLAISILGIAITKIK